MAELSRVRAEDLKIFTRMIKKYRKDADTISANFRQNVEDIVATPRSDIIVANYVAQGEQIEFKIRLTSDIMKNYFIEHNHEMTKEDIAECMAELTLH